MCRPSREGVSMSIAYSVSMRSTCSRRNAGCVLVDNVGHILSTGYNGVPSGMDHCKGGTLCEGAMSASGEGLDKCEAVHAEQNALLQCPDVYAIHTCYTTTLPCIHCMKLLMNTGCQRIVYSEDYPHSNARKLWLEAGMQLEQINSPALHHQAI